MINGLTIQRLVAIVVTGFFAVAWFGCGSAPVAAPQSYGTYSAKDGTFQCEYPEGWEVSGGKGAGRPWARFEQGNAHISAKASEVGSIIGDIVGAGAGSGDGMQETPPELSADIIDRGIIMTGGSSQLRHLPELVFRRTGVKAILSKDAQSCVAKGTGVALNHLDLYKKSIIAKR